MRHHSRSAINKRAKRDEWTRDLAAKIQAKAEAKVCAAKQINENQVVEANAELQYQVRMRHRAGLVNLTKLLETMLDELAVASDPEGMVLLEQLRELVNGSPDPDDQAGQARADRQQRAFTKAMERGVRIDDLKKLAEIDERSRVS